MMKDSETSFSGLLDLLARSDRAQIARVVADDVVFSSPVADYRGREDVVHLLGLVATVLRHPVPSEITTHGLSRLTLFSAGIGTSDEDVDGVLHEIHDADGRLLHITLFLRPLAALRHAIRQMDALLTRYPLPSSLR